ncbi:autotransporter domain-containing protein [Novilysobacter spongiicola]|uniref:Outer membrane lipase/esterase n=1 Tax=Lysobacter spongiicola DSM 21749 TaxID=1122188 RepID=A0A1T4RYY1_9GAMM|nr:autotransporter domain-containing protein [Lysobacter spongiicola]SKA21183.1 outer membrane lipase/esterase [Lysobacter spongiicola DSM 21749]
MKPVRTLLAVALALATAPAMAESANEHPYSQTIFFGDSLTDSGHFRPVLVEAVGPQAAILGKFTTNPWLVWSEYLAEFYGTAAAPANQGGSNYAVGGARVAEDSIGALGPTPSMATQVGNYLASTGGVADPDALYTVWGGNNDLFAVAAGAPPETTIGAAVGAQVGIVGSLQAAGAQYVLVPSIPDLGLTPAARAQGPAAQAQLTQLASVYNDALFGGFEQAGLRVIPLDMFHLFQEVVADPGAFGFANVTGTACQPQITAQSVTCNPTSYVTPDAATSYAFADGVHPSGAAHEVVADYAAAVLEGPRQIAVLPNSAAMTGRARADRVSAQLVVPDSTDGMRWWGDVRGDFQRYGHGDLHDGAGPALTVGVDRRSGGLVFGGFGGFGRQAQDWGRRGGSFDQSEATIGAYLGWNAGAAWINAQASYTSLGFDIERNVVLGQATRVHRADIDGSNVSFGLNGGWEFGDGQLRHGPVVGVLAQKIEIDGFGESDPDLSTSLAYPEQSYDSLVGSVGWQVRFDGGALQPYARLTADREFEDEPEQAFGRLQSMPGTSTYAVPGVSFDDSYGTLVLGTRSRMFGMDANVGASLAVGQEDGGDATVFATIGNRF